MLGVAGLLGVAFFAYLWTQLASLSDKISKAAGDVQTLTALVSSNETRLSDILNLDSEVELQDRGISCGIFLPCREKIVESRSRLKPFSNCGSKLMSHRHKGRQ